RVPPGEHRRAVARGRHERRIPSPVRPDPVLRGRNNGTMTEPRTIPPMEADERATLTAFLDRQRATLAVKCEGLTDDQLREPARPPSNRLLRGLVRHMG